MTLRRETLLTNMKRWFRNNGWEYPQEGTPFTVPFLTEELGMNADSRIQTRRVYQGIRYMIKQCYNHWVKENGNYKGENRFKNWDSFMITNNRNDRYMFLSVMDRKQKYYIQPSLSDLEKIGYKRLLKQSKSIATIASEMNEFDLELLTSGRPVGELLDANKKMKDVYLLNGKYAGKKIGLVDQRYHKCPFCKDRKFTSLAQLQRHMIYKHKMERKRND